MSMFESCLEKQRALKQIFTLCKSSEDYYKKIIEWGRNLPKINHDEKTSFHLVPGCQSQLYLVTTVTDGKLFFKAESNALISAGLASILIYIYSNELPETILKCPPKVLEDIHLFQHLSPSRSNGLHSLYLKMKQEALKKLI